MWQKIDMTQNLQYSCCYLGLKHPKKGLFDLNIIDYVHITTMK